MVEVLNSSIPNLSNLSKQGPLFEEINFLVKHFIRFEVHHVGKVGMPS